jgi:hypothetical protein
VIYSIPEKYDIIISYSWCKVNHGKISGHTFEVLDYYFFLSKYYKVGIFIGDGKSKEDILNLARDKYTVTPLEEDILVSSNPKILKAANQTVIITDGSASTLFSMGGFILCKNLILFRCGKIDSFEPLDNRSNVYLLQDNRVYSDAPLANTIDYKKKILFSALKPKTEKGTSTFLYLTSNCRRYNIDEVKKHYDFEEYITCTKDPIPDLINKINAYIYTPVFCPGSSISETLRLDCSPRLIAECKFYNIPVYYYKIDYEDKGLEARRYDVDNDFKSIELLESDYILTLLKEVV